MKIYISADIEGVTGCTHWNETYTNKADYAEFRDQMTAEVAAACEGALAAGATEIWVQDAHGGGRNIVAERLPEQVRLIRGWSHHPFSMVQELDGSFDALCMVGYHAAGGTDANPLSHAMTTRFAQMTVNGRIASEFLIHAWAAETVGVPTAFVSGDEGLCEEVCSLQEKITTVGVKRGAGSSTINLHPRLAVKQIRDGVEAALKGELTACHIALPEKFEVALEFKEHHVARQGSYYPGMEQTGPRTLRFATPDWYDVLRMLLYVL